MTASAVHPADLEPSLLAPSTYASRRQLVRLDVAAVISILICLLYMLPATLVVPSLTFAGRPALVLALGLFAWWFIARLHPSLLLVGPQPLRWACLFFLLSILLSYGAGLLRGLPTLEANRQDFTMLVTFQFIGVVLMVADGIPNWGRLNAVLKTFVFSAGFMALIGLVQNLFQYDVTRWLVLPGLELHSDLVDFQARGELFRVAATTVHSIEFSTVMALVVPYAIHCARFAGSRAGRVGFGVVALLVTAVNPMAISRTGVIALGAAVAVMFVLAWNWRVRYNVLLLGCVLLGLLVVARPGLIGTLRAMFIWADADPSVEGRTDDYAYVSAWFSQRPWLGRGPGTLIPDLYLILDNQWLLTLVTGGIIGVAALAAFHFTCIGLAFTAMRRATNEHDRHLCAALISTQVVAMLVAATFDSFSFTTFSFTLALTSGMCGAVWRFTHPARTVRTSTVNRLSR